MAAAENDRFVVGALHGALPLLIWAAHFFVAYMTIKAACALGLQRFTLAGVPAITFFLWLLSGVAIGALVWLITLAVRQTRRQAERGTLSIVHAGASVLALAGVLWSTLPIALVPPCANSYEFTAATAPFSATPSTLDTWVVR